MRMEPSLEWRPSPNPARFMPDNKKFLFVSLDGLIADIAWQVVKEGHPVKLFIESPAEHEIGDGFVPKSDDWERDVSWADVVVFDPKTVQDVATFEKPKQYPRGIDQVIVNGVVVVENGSHTGAKPGKVVFGPAYKGKS